MLSRCTTTAGETEVQHHLLSTYYVPDTANCLTQDRQD